MNFKYEIISNYVNTDFQSFVHDFEVVKFKFANIDILDIDVSNIEYEFPLKYFSKNEKFLKLDKIDKEILYKTFFNLVYICLEENFYHYYNEYFEIENENIDTNFFISLYYKNMRIENILTDYILKREFINTKLSEYDSDLHFDENIIKSRKESFITDYEKSKKETNLYPEFFYGNDNTNLIILKNYLKKYLIDHNDVSFIFYRMKDDKRLHSVSHNKFINMLRELELIPDKIFVYLNERNSLNKKSITTVRLNNYYSLLKDVE